MTHKLDDIQLFCSECGGINDNGEFTFQQRSLIVLMLLTRLEYILL